jgi:lipoate---protein ligase
MTDFGSYDLDEDLIEDGRSRVRVIAYPRPTVVIGRGGKPDVELNLEAIRADGIPVLRRRGGGCSVLLDPGNAIVSVVLPIPGMAGITSGFDRISQWLIGGLSRMGVPGVEQMGVSDLVLGDRKIGGSCIYRRAGLLYYSSTLLVDPDAELAERYLAHPPREPDYRAGRSHRDFMGALREVLGHADVAAFGEQLEAILRETLHVLPGTGPREVAGRTQN